MTWFFAGCVVLGITLTVVHWVAMEKSFREQRLARDRHCEACEGKGVVRAMSDESNEVDLVACPDCQRTTGTRAANG